MMIHYLLTGLGGAIGAMARLLISKLLPSAFFGLPIPTLVINVLGCFVMGILTEWFALYWSAPDKIRYFLVSGFLGGFTTFSAFSLEFGLLFQKNELILSGLYLFLTVFLSLCFFFAGIKLVRLF